MNKDNILFGYSCTPACGFFKDEGGFSIEIDKNGILIYKTYLFDFIEQTRTTIKLPLKTIYKVHEIMKKKAFIIQQLNTQLDNDSDDGVCNRFIFDGKEIVAWNIEFTNEAWTARKNPSYYQEFETNIKQENEVVKTFKLIAKVLKKNGIVLTLDKIRFHRKGCNFKICRN